MLIRADEQGEHASIYAVNVAAFETSDELRFPRTTLVDALRDESSPLVSLAAEVDRAMVLELTGVLVGASGTAAYHRAFNGQ